MSITSSNLTAWEGRGIKGMALGAQYEQVRYMRVCGIKGVAREGVCT